MPALPPEKCPPSERISQLICDLRKGFDSLAAQAQTVLGQDPFSGHDAKSTDVGAYGAE